jgi:plasmid maintenance system antidote protein VapI
MNKFITTELIGKSSRLITNNLAHKLLVSKIGITTEQWIILQILSRGAKTQKELSEVTLKNKASINSLVSNEIRIYR